MGVQSDEKEEEMEFLEETIEEYLKDKHLIAMETNDPRRPIFYEYDGSKYKETGDKSIEFDLDRYSDKMNYYLSPKYLKWGVKEVKRRAPRIKPNDFFKNENGVYRIPGIKNDLLVDPNHDTLKVVDKDPVNYPSTIALPIDFTHTPPKEMPKELQQILTITPPQYQEALLFELVSPLSFQKQPFINYIVDYWAVALDTISGVIRNLYGNLVQWREFWNSHINNTLFNAYLLDEPIVYAYIPGRLSALKKFVFSPELICKFKYHAQFTLKNRFPIIMTVDSYKDMPEPLIIENSIIIPITYTVVGTPDPDEPTRKINGIYWDAEIREKILLWLIHNMLLRYLKGEYKKYMHLFSKETIMEWEKRGEPNNGVVAFATPNILEAHGPPPNGFIDVTDINDVYSLYLKYTFGKYMPVSLRQFKEALESYTHHMKFYLNTLALESLKEEH